MGNNVMVTGGTGLVGSNLLYKLTLNDIHVTALKRNGSDINVVKEVFSFYETDQEVIENLFSRIHWIEGDLTDYYSILDALENIDYVYHSAAYVSFNPKRKNEVFKINKEGTCNLVNACLEKKIKKFAHISSIGALGTTVDNLPIDENTSWNLHKRRSNYSQSKFDAEMEVWRASKEGLPVIIINPGIIIGPGTLDRSSGNLIYHGKNGYLLYPPGATAFVDVRDVVDILIMLMQRDTTNERFIISSDNISFKTILQWVSNYLNTPQPKYEVPRWVAELAWRMDRIRSVIFKKEPFLTNESIRASYSKMHFSNQKIKDLLNYKFISVEKSIKDTCNWYKLKNYESFL